MDVLIRWRLALRTGLRGCYQLARPLQVVVGRSRLQSPAEIAEPLKAFPCRFPRPAPNRRKSRRPRRQELCLHSDLTTPYDRQVGPCDGLPGGRGVSLSVSVLVSVRSVILHHSLQLSDTTKRKVKPTKPLTVGLLRFPCNFFTRSATE